MKSINIKFPLEDYNVSNKLFSMNYTSKNAYSSDLLLLLLTSKGERYYNPDYGCNLIKFIFEPNDNITTSDIEKDIKDTVSKYIPSLKVNKVTFNADENDENKISVTINFIYSENTLTESGELTINF